MPDQVKLACTDASDRSLRPERALLTPTWVASLALLVANDHWLKGSGLLPDFLTGKLSDFAGLLMAPVLLATLLRVRTRRGLLACHLAVAAVFAGIQISVGFADQWSALMGLLGHPWTITSDLSDLIALPFLLLSWKLLLPEMDDSKPMLVPLQRTAVAGLSVFGLWSTVATSDIDSGIDPNDIWYQDVYGAVYINNANEFDISLFVRPLRDDLSVECYEVAADPGRLLTEDAFAEAQVWSLPPRTNVALDITGNRACAAALVAGEGIEPQIIFFDSNDYEPFWHPGQVFDTDELDRAGMAIVFAEGGSEWIGGEEIRYTPTDATPEQPEVCEASPLEARLDWSKVGNGGTARIESINLGPDGCYEIDLQLVEYLSEQVMDVGVAFPWYLCVPEIAMPFAVGDYVGADEVVGNVEMQLKLQLLDPATLEVAFDDQGRELLTVHYLRGGHDPVVMDDELARSMVAVPRPTCPWMTEDSCATVERTMDVGVSGGQGFLPMGEATTFADNTSDMNRTAILAYARERAVLDAACSEGANLPDYDIDLAIIVEPMP